MGAAPDRAGVPVWLLDVDGVLNARRPGWDGAAAQGIARHGDRRFRLTWSPELVDQITALHNGGGVEIRWATTWVDHIDQVQTLLRLPAFPLAFVGTAPSSRSGGGVRGAGPDPDLSDLAWETVARKTRAALAVVEVEGRALVWTDDDAIPVGGPARKRLDGSGQPSLLIAPDTVHGLTPDQMHRVADFLTDLGTRTSPSATRDSGSLARPIHLGTPG